VKRIETRYVCQACAAEVPRWEGQCRACGQWNTLVETLRATAPAVRRRPAGIEDEPAPVRLADVEPGSAAHRALDGSEIDRVLGGGIVPGSLALLAGEPGVGKSTLVLGAAARLAGRTNQAVLYVSGEESPGQVRLRAERLGVVGEAAGELLRVMASTDVDAVVAAARALGPTLLVVDSIQSLATADLDSTAGSVGQVRESAQRLLALAKAEGIATILIGHVTKDGTVAGPKTLEHVVDVVLTLEGDPGGGVRLLRATKNRFGSTEEIGLFEMGPGGLRTVPDPGDLFARPSGARPPGSAIALLLEGSRPLVVEVQALVGGGGYGPPRRAASGIDLDRLALLGAVLGKRAGVSIGSHDVYAALAGGLRSREPALDLPLALAIASSLRDRRVMPGTVAAAEISLAGELRPVPGLERRLREAARLGCRRAIVAEPNARGVEALTVVGVPTLRDALDAALEPVEGSVRRADAAATRLAEPLIMAAGDGRRPG
jgi:DNA repair protein RadA/Sms